MTTESFLLNWCAPAFAAFNGVVAVYQWKKIRQLQDLVRDLKAESQRRVDTICKMNEWIDNKNGLLMEQSEDIERLEDAIARLGIGEDPKELPPQAREV